MVYCPNIISIGVSNQPANRRKPKKHNSPQQIPEGVLFVPHTQGGQLKKMLQRLEDDALSSRKVGRIRMVERGGDTLLS